MLRLAYNNDTMEADLVLGSTGLVDDDGLETAVLISLFTDNHATPDDDPPGGETDLRGWWGDMLADQPGDEEGSLLWLLERSKNTPDALAKAKRYGEKCLAWMVEDGVASKVVVEAESPRKDWLAILVRVFRPGDLAPRWQHTWEVYLGV